MAKTQTAMSLGDNVAATLGEDGMLILRIDTKHDGGKTAGGNARVASTFGNRNVEGLTIGLNVYRKERKAE